MATKQKSTKKAAAPPQQVPPTTAASLNQVAEHLDDTAVLLHGLHRRHKNQHRVSTYWWPSFGQLRRAVARLREDMQSAGQSNGIQRLTSRVGATRALVPKVYLAFSRLVADKQFAPLGLLLVGVLAQVQSAVNGIERILGITADPSNAANGKASGSTDAPPTSAFKNTGKQSASRSLPDIDFGIAISRDDGIDGMTTESASASKRKKRARRDDSDEDTPELAAASAPGTATTYKATDTHGPKPHAEKKRKIAGDKGGTMNEHEGVRETTEKTTSADASEPRDKERKERTKMPEKIEKKIRRGKGEKEKEKDKSKDKKKKRKRGDEFDDLFSGLL